MPSKSLSVIIPNYNGASLLPRFMPSVIRAVETFRSRGGDAELIVVDDASKDNSVELLQQMPLQLFVRPTNGGFSAACNSGASLATKEILFFLNTDVELPEDFFNYFSEHFADPLCFAVTIQGYQYRTGQRLDGVKTLRWSRGFMRVTDNNYPEPRPHHFEPSWGVQGAYFFVEASKFHALGGFDELMNPYIFEETDLCYRALKRGWVIHYEARCLARHDHSTTLKSVASRRRIDQISFRNKLIFIWKNIHSSRLLAEHFLGLLLKLLSLKPWLWRGFLDALRMIPEIASRRKEEIKAARCSDEELLNQVQRRYPRFQLEGVKTGIGTALFFILFEILCRNTFRSVTTPTLLSYLITFLFSLFFWCFWDDAQKLLPLLGRKIFAISIAPVLALLTVSQWVLYREFGEYLSPFMLLYAVRDPRYLSDSMESYIGIRYGGSLLLLSVLFYFLWHPRRLGLLTNRRKMVAARALLFLILSLVALNQVKWLTSGQVKGADGSFIYALDSNFTEKRMNGLHVTVRQAVPPLLVKSKHPDIFLFIGESWGKQKLPLFGYNKNTTPHLMSLWQSERQHLLLFKRGHANSGATDVSLPSLLTGVGPEQSSELLHSQPLLWDWARAAGYRSVFASPQRLVFGHINRFLLTPGPDIFLPGNAISQRIVNDQGVDEILAAERLATEIRQQPTDQPLLVVYFSNALHFPFQTSTPKASLPPELTTPYEKALFIHDQAMGLLVEALKQRGKWDETLVWWSADHGELEGSQRKVPRVVSFYEEVLSIPFMIKWPEKGLDHRQQCRKELEQHQTQNVQNVDIVPTLIDLWGLSDSSYASLLSNFRGQSLCRPQESNRPLLHLNTNGIRQWTYEGYAITSNHLRWVFSNIEGHQLFDFVTDPLNQKNLLPTADQATLSFFEKVVAREPELQRIGKSKPK